MPDSNTRFSGLFVPVTTTFDAVTGDVAPVSFRENLRRWADSSLDGFVLFGSTGEGVLLATDEKLQLLGCARDVVPAGCMLVAGAGAESTRGAVHEVQVMADAGADAVMVHPPYYFGSTLSADALREHYLVVAEQAPIPVIVYHIPAYTHVVMEPAMVSQLARHPNVVALKDSSGDLKRLAGFSEVCGPGCGLLVGNGSLFYTALEMGAAGGILALGLLAPDQCAGLLEAFRAGDRQRAGALQERLAPAHKQIVGKYGVPGVKAALDLLGMEGGSPRLPLQPLRERERQEVAGVLRKAGLKRQ